MTTRGIIGLSVLVSLLVSGGVALVRTCGSEAPPAGAETSQATLGMAVPSTTLPEPGITVTNVAAIRASPRVTGRWQKPGTARADLCVMFEASPEIEAEAAPPGDLAAWSAVWMAMGPALGTKGWAPQETCVTKRWFQLGKKGAERLTVETDDAGVTTVHVADSAILVVRDDG